MGRNIIDGNQQTPTLLILSPHPDDLELSCGLLCHQAMLLGWRVLEIVLTDGAAGGIDLSLFHTDKIRELRVAEARRGGMLLGVEEIEFWGYADSNLNQDLQSVILLLQDRLKFLSPTVLVFPSINDTHPDHFAAYTIVMSVLEQYKKELVTLQYCFWGKDDNQNIILSHTSGVQAKESAIKEHKTQPIDKYLSRLNEGEKKMNDFERYFSPNPNKTISVLIDYGFRINLI